MDGVHHELESGIDEPASVFGVEVFDEGGRVFDISKEGGNGFALAVWSTTGFHGGLLSKDTLG
jgi:hypothetical protein